MPNVHLQGRRNGTAKTLYNIEPAEPDKNHFTTSSVDTNKPYKFVFAMENDFVEGYWTEKLVNPIFAESIPIMAGCVHGLSGLVFVVFVFTGSLSFIFPKVDPINFYFPKS